MENPVRRLISLPVPAMLVVVALALLVPLGVYFWIGIREWQEGGSAAEALTARFFWVIALGRGAGAVALAILLLYWRRPAAVAITLTAVWLAGPPVTFLWMGIIVLAASAGQASWAGSSIEWLGRAALFPALVTVLLLGPPSARRAFGIS